MNDQLQKQAAKAVGFYVFMHKVIITGVFLVGIVTLAPFAAIVWSVITHH